MQLIVYWGPQRPGSGGGPNAGPAQSVTQLWLAYRVGVVEQCCQMV